MCLCVCACMRTCVMDRGVFVCVCMHAYVCGVQEIQYDTVLFLRFYVYKTFCRSCEVWCARLSVRYSAIERTY